MSPLSRSTHSRGTKLGASEGRPDEGNVELTFPLHPPFPFFLRFSLPSPEDLEAEKARLEAIDPLAFKENKE